MNKTTAFGQTGSTMPQDAVPTPRSDPDRLEAATDQAIAACGGNARDAVKALIVANEYLESEICDLMQVVSLTPTHVVDQDLHRVNKVADYRLHCVGASGNSYKVALYLNCAGVDWEPVGVDFAGGQTRDAKWRADINSMGEIPVLEVNGKRMSQSGAILLWLAETTGKFAPTSGHRFEAMRWLFFDNHKFSNNYAMHRVQNCMTPQAADPAVLAFLRSRVESAFSIAEKHFKDHPFVLGDSPTIVDFSMAGYVYYPAAETGFDIAAEYQAIDAWRERVAALPGWKPPYQLMPVGSSLPVRGPSQNPRPTTA